MFCMLCDRLMTPVLSGGPLYLCERCQLVSSIDPPDVSFYDKSYCVKYKRYERGGLNDELQKVRLDMVLRHSRPDFSLLDFGCGSGAFLEHVRKRCGSGGCGSGESGNGVVAVGFDINPYGGFCDVSGLWDAYDVATFWDVLEHLPNPIKVVRGIRPAFLFACTPSTDDIEGGIKKGIWEWHHYYPEEHVHYFNEVSLAALFEKCGYEVLESHYEESKVRASGGERNILSMAGRRKPRIGERS